MSGSKIGFNPQTTNNFGATDKQTTTKTPLQTKVLQTDEYTVRRGDTLTNRRQNRTEFAAPAREESANHKPESHQNRAAHRNRQADEPLHGQTTRQLLVNVKFITQM